MNIIREFTLICRDAVLACGWEGGLRVERDTRGMTGGSPANTVHASMVWNKVGQDNAQREFSHMVLTEAEQNQGEAVSSYLKTVKMGAAPAWGACIEANDPAGKVGALIGAEVDIFATGPATNPDDGDGSNGGRVRVALDVVGGDEQAKQGGPASGAQGTAGLRVYATSTTPWFRWIFGAWLADYARTGLRLNGKGAERAIDIQGSHTVGVDFSRGDFQSVTRLREGQAYSFDQYDDWLMRRQGDEVQILQRSLVAGHWQHVPVFAVTRDGEVKARKFTQLAP